MSSLVDIRVVSIVDRIEVNCAEGCPGHSDATTSAQLATAWGAGTEKKVKSTRRSQCHSVGEGLVGIGSYLVDGLLGRTRTVIVTMSGIRV